MSNNLAKLTRIVPVLAALSGISGVAQAQSDFFIGGFSGYSFGSSDMDLETNEGDSSSLKISDSNHFGFIAGVETDDPGDIYFLYSRQSTDLRTGNSEIETPFAHLDVDYYHLGGSLYFPKDKLRPYVTASLGMTNLRPNDSANYDNESNFSLGFGAGLEYQFTERFSAFADLRGFATFINSSSSLFCSGGCIVNISADLMWQGQGNLGVKVKF